MQLQCEFSNCKWIGYPDNLFDHCERFHKNYIREVIEGNSIDFNFDEFIQIETFLICGENGLYWLKGRKQTDIGLTKQIFPIGESEMINFTLKIGKNSTGYVSYIGLYQVQIKNHNSVDLILPFAYIEFINDLNDKSITLYLGEFDDSEDVFMGESCDIDWNDEAEIKCNTELLEKFTCIVCLEYIKCEARFCENKHYMCCNCFNELIKRKILKCPICGRYFPYDCRSENIETVLKLLKYPE